MATCVVCWKEQTGRIRGRRLLGLLRLNRASSTTETLKITEQKCEMQNVNVKKRRRPVKETNCLLAPWSLAEPDGATSTYGICFFPNWRLNYLINQSGFLREKKKSHLVNSGFYLFIFTRAPLARAESEIARTQCHCRMKRNRALNKTHSFIKYWC